MHTGPPIAPNTHIATTFTAWGVLYSFCLLLTNRCCCPTLLRYDLQNHLHYRLHLPQWCHPSPSNTLIQAGPLNQTQPSQRCTHVVRSHNNDMHQHTYHSWSSGSGTCTVPWCRLIRDPAGTDGIPIWVWSTITAPPKTLSLEYTAPSLVYDKLWGTPMPLILLTPSTPLEPPDPPITTDACSSLDETLIPPSLSTPDDLGQYQNLLWHMATALNLPAEDVKDPQDEFLDILQPAGASHIALQIHNAILQPAQAIWHVPASCTPTLRHMRGAILSQPRTPIFFIHLPPNSLVVQVAIQCARQQHF